MIFSLPSWGQSHLLFRDTPIDGKLVEFVKKMKSLGYSSTHSSDRAEILEGSFAGKNAQIYVLSTPKTNITYKVVVQYPEGKTWLKLKQDYLDIKDLFCKKYGKPADVFEFFTDPYQEGDGYEIQALKSDKGHYVSYWDDKGGTIELSISDSCNISISYEDKQNISVADKEKEDQRLNDI